jgi:hypothetical protein
LPCLLLAAGHAPAGGSRAAYDVLIGLHVAAALVGFGAVALDGAYGGTARRAEVGGATAAEEMRRYFSTPGRLSWAVVVVPFLGAAALAVKPGPSSFGQAWVGIGLALWVVAVGLLFGVARPAAAVLRRAARAGAEGGGGIGLGAAGKRLAWAGAASDLVFVVALVVMVIQPGS